MVDLMPITRAIYTHFATVRLLRFRVMQMNSCKSGPQLRLKALGSVSQVGILFGNVTTGTRAGIAKRVGWDSREDFPDLSPSTISLDNNGLSIFSFVLL